ncbi:MAG: DUF1059 domain-containing protein [Chloroflexi bacterium]|uniref:DUF1059 domain-containing protein n=1 Tax=Candidatus Chlorohelix allophototropha TaxID=3003348 RepID=A0A8T7LR63_9CHLR|nr:DUF1059 domain-containing protein [Chloroflexota bacterium]WJW66416.1 DUF1059 domain-containing protein [Chloroflexota bacterium L227-S17]
MSKEFHCRDMDMDCDFVMKGETNEEVSAGAFAHAAAVHPDVLASIPPEQMAGMQDLVISKIRDVEKVL